MEGTRARRRRGPRRVEPTVPRRAWGGRRLCRESPLMGASMAVCLLCRDSWLIHTTFEIETISAMLHGDGSQYSQFDRATASGGQTAALHRFARLLRVPIDTLRGKERQEREASLRQGGEKHINPSAASSTIRRAARARQCP